MDKFAGSLALAEGVHVFDPHERFALAHGPGFVFDEELAEVVADALELGGFAVRCDRNNDINGRLKLLQVCAGFRAETELPLLGEIEAFKIVRGQVVESEDEADAEQDLGSSVEGAQAARDPEFIETCGLHYALASMTRVDKPSRSIPELR